MDINIGKGITVPVTVEDLPPAALQHVIYIGLRNVLMDSHAGVTADAVRKDHPQADAEDIATMVVDQSRATAEKKLASLLAGEVRTIRERTGDPVRAEALRMAIDAVRAAVRKRHAAGQGAALKDVKPEAIRAAAEKIIDRYIDVARRIVEERKALGGVEDIEL